MSRILVLLIVGLWPAMLMAQSTIHEAALTGNTDAIVKFVKEGGDPDAPDPYGSTPLSVAIIFDRVAAVRALVGAGADPDATDAHGSAPLHLAAFFGRVEVARVLVESSADIAATNAQGLTALEIAERDFDLDRPLYTALAGGLVPLGFQPNETAVIAARPRIAAILRGGRADAMTQDEAMRLMYAEAAELDTLYALLVLQDGAMLREGYFNGHDAATPTMIQSAAKSVLSAMIGIGLERGCIRDLDLTAAEIFAGEDLPADKAGITLRQLLQMRSGLPCEETDPALWQELMRGQTLHAFAEFPVTAPPGAAFNYSNLTANLLAQTYERLCDPDIRAAAARDLFGPIGVAEGMGDWWTGEDGYHYPILHLTARTAAAFGQLFLNGGTWQGQQVVSADWVAASLTPYTAEAWREQSGEATLGSYFEQVGYGYQWWTARVGRHDIAFAWGHGGQLVVLVPDRQMVIVTQSDPFWEQHDAISWRHEQEIINLVGRFLTAF